MELWNLIESAGFIYPGFGATYVVLSVFLILLFDALLLQPATANKNKKQVNGFLKNFIEKRSEFIGLYLQYYTPIYLWLKKN